MNPGIHDISDEEYFAADALSNSYLWKLITKTPAHAQVPTAKTDAMDLGSAVHVAVLQPDLASDLIIQGPADRRGKKWKEALEKAEKESKILLVERDYTVAMTMRDKVWNSPTFTEILTGKDAKYEQAAFWMYKEQLCKCKLDCIKQDLLIDLKTSVDASPAGFAQAVAKYGYHQQAASYLYGYNQASGKDIQTFLFLVIEKSPPYAPAIYELDTASLREGWASYNAALERHVECVATKHFPAYPDEKVQIQIPQWAFAHTNPRNIDLKGEAL